MGDFMCHFYVAAGALHHGPVNSGRLLFASESSLFQPNVTYLEFSSDFVFVFVSWCFSMGLLANQKKKVAGWGWVRGGLNLPGAGFELATLRQAL